ncbi:MAG: hypothetical protein HGA45_36765, partial [Chloroflexales bacterium]|nr:hypothetical protein [Chloroflexales bacterium]
LVAGATGAYLEVIEITSTDTVARDVTLFLSDGTTDYFYDTVAVAAATALVKVVKVNLLDANRRSSLDPNNIRKILGLNWRFKVRVETAVTAGAEVAVLCDYGEF